MTKTPEQYWKILVLSHSYIRHADDFAGLFVHTLNRALRSIGCRITVIAPHAQGLLVKEVMDGVTVNRFRYMIPSLETIAYRGTMHDIVRGSFVNQIIFVCFMKFFLLRTIWNVLSARPHVIHAHWWFPGGLVAYLVSVIFRVPYVITIHGTDAHIAGSNMFLTRLFRIVLRRSIAVVVGSEYLKKVVEKSLPPEDPARERILKIGVPVEVQSEQSSRSVKVEKNLVLTVARLTPQKNVRVMIEALSLLSAKNIEFKASVIGDGPLKKELDQQIIDAGLEDRVKILPSVDRGSIFDHYRRCAVFVLPSLREGLGLVLVEALLMKKPVIASNDGGATEIIENEISGILFDPGHPEQLAEAVERLLEDPELAGRLAERGCENATREFSPGRVGAEYVRIYQKAFA